MNCSFQNIYITSLILLYSITSSAQTQWIDSIKKVSETQKSDTNKLFNLLGLSNSYRQFNPDSSITYGQKSLALSEKLDYQPGVFGSEVVLSQSLMIAGNYPLALEYCFKAQVSAKKIKDTSALSYSDYLLSDCYYHLGDYNTSLNYLRRVITTVTKLYPHAMYQIWSNLSRLFDASNQPDSALFYAKLSYDGMKNNKCVRSDYEVKFELSRICPLLGNAYASKKQYDSALYYYRMGIPVSISTYLQIDMIDDYNGIASVFRSTGDNDSAIYYSKKILHEKITRTYPAGLLKATNMLASVYESKNQPDSTLKYLKMAIVIKDNLFNRDKTIAVQNLTYREHEKQKEMIAAKEILHNRFKVYFILAGILVVALIAGILLKNKREKQMQSMRNSIADDLHDDIGSTLSSIAIMSELAKEKSPEALSLLESIGESTLSLQENMSDIVWAINPRNDRFENVLQRMNQFASEILDAKNIELDFTNDESVHATRLTMGQRKNFYLFFKEVINNAAKYSDAKKIFVSITKKDQHLEMNIRDNGKGFDTSKIFNGNGMNTLKKRGAELSAYFNIQSIMNEGTAVKLKFRIT